MRRLRPVWPTVMLLCVLLPLRVRAQSAGVLTGTVVNGTAGGGSIEGLEVTLRSFQGQEEREPRTTVTDASGAFRFEGLETGEDWVYLARVVYEGVVYSGGMVSLTPDQAEVSVQVPVYETTTDGSSITVERAHLFLTFTEGGVTTTELYVFQNPSDRTYVGVDGGDGQRWTAKFLLPEESHDLIFDDGSLNGRFRLIDGGFVDTEPQWPGTTQVLFSYTVDLIGGVADLSRTLAHPTVDLNVLIEETGATIESQDLVLEGTRQAEGQTYLNYVAHSLDAGQHLDLRVRLAAGQGAVRSTQPVRTQALPWILLGSVLAGLPLIYPFWRQRIQSSARKDG
jgi:hypothetical protein